MRQRLATIYERDQRPTNQRHHDTVYRNILVSLYTRSKE